MLNGNNEVPPVASSTQQATAVVRWINGGQSLQYSVTASAGLAGTMTGFHFHGPAATNATAGIVYNLAAVLPVLNSSQLSVGQGFVAKVSAADAATLVSGLMYLNIHTTSSPGGEIRGNIVGLTAAPAMIFGYASLVVSAAAATGGPGGAGVVGVQAGAGGTAFVSINQNTGSLTYSVTVAGLSGSVTAAHFHGPAPVGGTAGILLPINTFATGSSNTSSNVGGGGGGGSVVNIMSASGGD